MVGIISKCYKKKRTLQCAQASGRLSVHSRECRHPNAQNASSAGAERLCPGNQSREGAALCNRSVLTGSKHPGFLHVNHQVSKDPRTTPFSKYPGLTHSSSHKKTYTRLAESLKQMLWLKLSLPTRQAGPPKRKGCCYTRKVSLKLLELPEGWSRIFYDGYLVRLQGKESPLDCTLPDGNRSVVGP